MSNWILLLIFTIGTSTNNIVLVNHTGLKIVRIEIDGQKFEDVSHKADEILISVSPEKHDMKLTFKGGAQVDWPDFEFKGIHQITFERIHNKIDAHFN